MYRLIGFEKYFVPGNGIAALPGLCIPQFRQQGSGLVQYQGGMPAGLGGLLRLAEGPERHQHHQGHQQGSSRQGGNYLGAGGHEGFTRERKRISRAREGWPGSAAGEGDSGDVLNISTS